ncbi:hypothetical protein SSX86_017726 [Deinandra increscens subsp. villosa]|uniref:RING-type E3 ubiquitin transferase n=1 Tax=Deinandra increscens subsp. villosa TaxID=3103831 RepID=A0AAP0GX11_9ASTR
MNNPHYHHHHHIWQQPFYYQPYPVFGPPFVYNNQVISPSRYNPGPSRSVEYVDDIAILNTPNTLHHHPNWAIQPHSSYLHHDQYYLPYDPTPENPSFHSPSVSRAFEEFLDETLILLNLEAADSSLQDGPSGSGLSEETISEHLHVYTTQGKIADGEEAETCTICLDEFGENEKVGMLECRHKFHSECITSWLLSKNSCPMCRSTALKV